MNPDQLIIAGQGIEKEYSLPTERIVVLRGIDLEVKKGELVAIIGPSGSGKSTLLNILGTLDYPTKGKVILNATDLSVLPENQLAEIRNRSIGFIFQFHHLLPEFSLLENVALPALIANGNKAHAWENAAHLIEKMGLSGRITHRPSQLSGGEKQRVAVARALINSPQVLLADEPTGNLDMKNGEMLIETFLNFGKEEGLSIVLVTHNQNIASYAHRVLALREGRLYAV